MNDMPAALLIPPAVAGVASRTALAGAAAYAGKKIYDAIVDDADPDEALSPLIQPRTDAPPPPPPDDDEEGVDVSPDLDSDAGFEALIDERGISALDGAKDSAPPIIPDGDWKYQILPGGVVKIVAGPPGSTAIGKVLDPRQIAAMPDGASKARLTRAYESIKAVSQGKPPLPRLGAPKKPAPAVAPAAPTEPTPEPAAAPAPPPVQAAAPVQATPDGRPFGRVRRMVSRFYAPGAGADGSGVP